jgi:hypothetical protein
MGKAKATVMHERIILENNEDGRTWRNRFGKVQLKCPYCFKWFTLGSEFKIDDDGNVDQVIYHICESDNAPADRLGWVVAVQLKGWRS